MAEKDAPKGKTAPMSDVINLRRQLDKAKSDLAKVNELERENARLKKRLEFIDLSDVTDQDAHDIKELLVSRETELDERENKIKEREEAVQEKESTFSQKEKDDTVRTLAEKYGVEVEAIKDSEDPEKEALRLAFEGKNKETGGTPAENVFDGGGGKGIVKKQPKDMSDEEFADYEKAEKAKYYAAK